MTLRLKHWSLVLSVLENSEEEGGVEITNSDDWMMSVKS